MLRVLLALAVAAGTLAAQADSKAPFDAEALMHVARIGEPQLSPDGTMVAFSVQTIEVESNTRPRHIYVVPIEGGTPRRVTFDGSRNERPRWSPDSKQIAFISDRTGSSQVWIMDADGGRQRQVTDLATEASGVLYSPDGENLVFTSEVYPECSDDACNKEKLEAEKNSKVKARIYTGLLYRHWNEFKGQRRRHILVVPVEGGPARDLTPGDRDVPPFSLGGPDDYAISPDGAELCFVMNQDPDLALSTNSDLFVVPMEGGEPRRLTENPAADNSPLYSPDGKYIAFRMQTRPGYESDKWRLAVIDRESGRLTVLTEGLDRWVTTFSWTPDSARLVFGTEDRGRQNVQMIGVRGGGGRILTSAPSHVDDMQFTPDGATMVFTQHSGSSPVEIYRISSSGGEPVPLTRINDDLLARHELTPLEEFWVEGAEQARVHSFMVKPPGFNRLRRYPVLFLIHGGPQGAWGESWSYRWNPQVFAAAGYVVVMPNPRGSTGYGQKFIDEINADWGGRVYEDIMAVVDHVAALPYTDRRRMAAAGGSYGGYMVNWMLGHTDRFRAFVSHAGVFDLRSMAGETEEIWFPLWEFRGMPWENPDVYERWSPSNYVSNFRTPTLVIHGELDYRVPAGQGMQLFTALQMQKVQSKLLLFPDEGHWILKPQNSLLWYRTFIDWVDRHTRSER
ncbi:MAG: alpha/beta fold hydrolase [Bryobacteraceae bacterium]